MEKKSFLVAGIAGLLGAAAGLFMASKKKEKQTANTPPKAAPQLPIENPGDQSEFPTAPTEERDLG